MIQRDSIPFGPGMIVWGDNTYFSAGDIDVVHIIERAEVNPDQYGQGIRNVIDETIEVSFKPQSLIAMLTQIYTDDLVAPTTLGNRLIGSSPTPILIHGENGSLLTIPCPCVTGLPSLMIGVDKGEFGAMKFTGVVTNGMDPGDEGACYTYAATGGSYGTPSVPDYLAAAEWDVDWNDSALTGTLLQAVTINPDYKVEPVKAGPRTMDFRLRGIQFAASVVFNYDPAALSAIVNSGTMFAFGSRNIDQSGALVFTSMESYQITLANAAIDKNSAKLAMKEQFANAIDFRTTVLSGARVAFGSGG